ncbi:thioredoxin family protein [Hymenobacter sp. HMF4947]|uniref:Thioredoxin family protein n=1 Tax=Hymenobacter ginkgonis TaxID=2682976 RepID=A0A7K1TCM5_9BACT|nr:thioredoxin family protein [Hymenobacter ginkgonis]MVN76125.1 thioredoxin family protein [Hymenobacter ginkgonis]
MAATTAPVLTADQLATGLSYPAYRQHITEVLATPAPDAQLAKMLPHYQENVDRMEQVAPTVVVLPELQAALNKLTQKYIWAIITEGWCGDASQTVPIIEAVAQASGGHLETRYFLRDSHLDLIDRYLTNGGRAIPIAVVLHADSLTEAGVWGPRPTPLQAIMQDLKAHETPFKEIVTQVHAWYDQDATRTTQHELLALVQKLA